MAAHWDLSDIILLAQLQAYISELGTEDDPWTLHLYQNNYTPIPGSGEVDYVECDFPGYGALNLSTGAWGTVTIASHVASSTYTEALEFEAGSSGFSTQTVYGYYVLDSTDAYLYGERFADVRTMHPSDVLKVTPILRHTTYPNP